MALTPILRVALALLLALPLAACGTGRDDPFVSAARGLTGGFLGGEDTAEAAPVFTAETVPAELIAQLPGPLMLIEVQNSEQSSGMTRVGQNGADATWRGPNGIGLTLDGSGVVRSTRGFGSDLMAGDVRPVSAALSGRRSGPANRAMVHLDGNAQQIRRVYSCRVSIAEAEPRSIAGRPVTLTRATEACEGSDGYSFENDYWIDQSGRAVQSRQWISPQLGHIRITVLRD